MKLPTFENDMFCGQISIIRVGPDFYYFRVSEYNYRNKKVESSVQEIKDALCYLKLTNAGCYFSEGDHSLSESQFLEILEQQHNHM